MPTNVYDQPVGAPVADWVPRAAPPRAPIAGAFCRIEPLDPARHGKPFFDALLMAPDSRDWTYLPAERPDDLDGFQAYLQAQARSEDPLHFAVVDTATGLASGTAALMRIDRGNGVIEIGHILFAPRLQRTTAATEAIYLLMRRVFDELGYRRLEWKCDSLNAPSRAAALRLGFTFEGIFRQAVVTKSRNRDTAWYSMTDGDWRTERQAFEAWLASSNFDAAMRQKMPLGRLRGAAAD